MKRSVLYICILTLIISLFSLGASAASDVRVMSVDGKSYTDFVAGWNDAIAATANNDNTVKVVLYADWTAENGSFGEGKGFKKGAIYVPEETKDLSLDLNGYTIDRGLFVWTDIEKEPTVDNGRESGEVMHIDKGSRNIFISNGTISGANNKNYGGIYIDKAEEVYFKEITFKSNKSDHGGALYNNEGKVIFQYCDFTLNLANNGGAIFSDYDTVTLQSCKFYKNKANYSGGAIYNYDANFKIFSCEFKENVAIRITEYGEKYGSGGAIYTDDGNTELIACDFIGNSVYYSGGAIHHDDGDLTVSYCKFDNNVAFGAEHSNGGACYVVNDAKFYNCKFTNNSSKYTGAIYANDTISITDCIFTGNKSLEKNGQNASVLMVAESAEITMTDCTVTDNIGDCAIHLYAMFLDEGEIWFDGKMIVENNFNHDNKELNVVCTPGDPFTSSIILKKNFSKESRVGVGMYDSDNRGEEAVENIPEGWTIADLAACFKLDEVFLSGDKYPSDDPFYLELFGDIIEFHKGNPQNSIHSVAYAEAAQYKITTENCVVVSGIGKVGETIGIKAAHEDASLTFVRWEGEGIEFKDPDSTETTFVMPDNDVTVKAIFAVKPQMPTSDRESGKYDDLFSVSFASPEGKKILYGIGDGSPCTFTYSAPVNLNEMISMPEKCDDGLYRSVYYISALCVGDEGLQSDVIRLRFEIGEGYEFSDFKTEDNFDYDITNTTLTASLYGAGSIVIIVSLAIIAAAAIIITVVVIKRKK